jgi:hypothetical protein
MKEKTMNVNNIEDAKEKISDIEVVGGGDTFKINKKPKCICITFGQLAP